MCRDAWRWQYNNPNGYENDPPVFWHSVWGRVHFVRLITINKDRYLAKVLMEKMDFY